MADSETKINLPEGFLLGVAAAAHQVEGDNINSDWWHEELTGKVPKSGLACDHYHRFEEDFQIAKSLGLNAYRISIEWARIEPAEGRWDSKEVEHYRKVLKKMKELGLTRMVTLHHYTLPQWLAEKGGFEHQLGIEAFGRFAWFIAQNLGGEIDLWCTINEPEMYAGMAYSFGRYPPFKRNSFLYLTVLNNLILAHKKAYNAIKNVIPKAQIGIAKNYNYYEPFRIHHPMDRLLVWAANSIANHYFLNKIKNHMDYVGLNFYFFDLLKFKFPMHKLDMNYNFAMNRPKDPKTIQRSDMGWRTFPEGIYHALLDLKKYKKPIYITENGIANARDDMRKDYIRQHLHWTAKAIAEGADVRGYFYWSLTDNYEWTSGFDPKFGLVEINYETLGRTIRPSASIFKELQS